MKAQQNDHHWHRSKLATLDVIVRCFGKQTWYIGSLIFNKSQKKVMLFEFQNIWYHNLNGFGPESKIVIQFDKPWLMQTSKGMFDLLLNMHRYIYQTKLIYYISICIALSYQNIK